MIGNERPCCNIATSFLTLRAEVLEVDGKVHPLIGKTRILCDVHKDSDPDFEVLGPLPHRESLCQWGRQQ